MTKYEEFKDSEYVARAVAGDRHAAEVLVQQYYGMVYAVSIANLGYDPDQAEDLSQEVLLRAFLHLSTLRQPAYFPRWLVQIARNLAAQWKRQNRRNSGLVQMVEINRAEVREMHSETRSPLEAAVTAENTRLVQDALSRLPEGQREILLLHYMEAMPQAEIARKLGVHSSTVMRKMDSGLAALRKILGADPGGQLKNSARDQQSQRATAIVLTAFALPPAAKTSLASAYPTAGLKTAGAFSGLTLLKPASLCVLGVVAVGTYIIYRNFGETKEGHSAEPEISISTAGATVHRVNPSGNGASSMKRKSAAATTRSRTVTAVSTAGNTLTASISPGADKVDYLQGRVFDRDGKPIADALVDVNTWYPRSEMNTDAAGAFRLEGLGEREAVQVRISKDGYSPFYQAKQPLGIMPEPVILGRETAVEGTVTDPEGKPISGVEVKAVMRIHEGSHVTLHDIFLSNITDNAGRFGIPLSPETYTVKAQHGPLVAQREVILRPDQTERIDLQLGSGNEFRARLLDSITSEPVPGVQVTFKERSGLSDTSGVVHIRGLLSGKEREAGLKKEGYSRYWSESAAWAFQRLSRDAADWQSENRSLRFDIKDPMEEVIIACEKGATLGGTVVDPDDVPVEGATVLMLHAGAQGNGSTGRLDNAKTDAAGRFSMTLPASKETTCCLVAVDNNHYQSTLSFNLPRRQWADAATPNLRTQPGEEQKNLVIRLARPGTIHGRLLDWETTAPRVSTPVIQADWPGVRRLLWVPGAKVSETGEFQLNFVPPGTQQLRVVLPIDGGDANSFVPITPSDISLREGETTTGLVLRFVKTAVGR